MGAMVNVWETEEENGVYGLGVEADNRKKKSAAQYVHLRRSFNIP